MGTSLINTTPANTYPALIKVGDNTSVDATLKALSDGEGNDLPLEVSSTAVNFTGLVTGLPPQQRGFYPYTVTIGTTTGVLSAITSATAPSGANLVGAIGWGFAISGNNVSITHPLGNTILLGVVKGINGAQVLIRTYIGTSTATASIFQNNTYTVITFYANTSTNAGYNSSATNANALRIIIFSTVYS